MRGFFWTFALFLAAALNTAAGEWSGYIADSSCAKKMSSSATASASHAECAQRCIKNGAKAVLVTLDGTIYSIANTEKVIDYAGQKVVIEGDHKGDTIQVNKVRN
jgi:hypothetical protein